MLDEVPKIVAELRRVSGELPVIKLDADEDHVTLTVVTDDEAVRSYRWLAGVISEVDSDVEYLGQATFTPATYPLDDLRRLFDVAGLLADSTENQVLQIVQYRQGEVFMSVTTRPESKTVFFRSDGTAITELGVRGEKDIAEGLDSVIGTSMYALGVGFSKQAGYWAEVKHPGGVVERRTRMAALPVFSSQRSETTSLEVFPTSRVKPEVIAETMAEFRADPEQNCSVEIDNRHKRVQPVIQYSCGEELFFSDMAGRDMTSQFAP